MSIQVILILVLASLGIGLVKPRRLRSILLAGACILAVFWLQPTSPIRTLDFWLPAITLALATAGWLAVTPAADRNWRSNLPWIAGAAGLVVLIGLTRYLSLEGIITASRPPAPWLVMAGLGILAAAASLPALDRNNRLALAGLMTLLVAVFIIQKDPPLAEAGARVLRNLTGQDASLASSFDIRWLGYSYVAFRLIHTLRDRQSGRLPKASFPEYLTYLLFFPALPAGPIDRLERFLPDLRQAAKLDAAALAEGGRRLVIGLFKKFVLADLLSLVALNPDNAGQIRTQGWTWLFLYAYAFQIYFDFSGYTDIAIGLGRWMGVRLPENFNRPYLRQNLPRFWDAWHMSLTAWFRGYIYNPLTRRLLRSRRLAPAVVLLAGQAVTMTLIGLWHGITWNFLIWGLWHATGLFLQNRWSTVAREKIERLPGKVQTVLRSAGTLLTFHYVALGWVWFVLPDPGSALVVFKRLAGG